MSATAPTEGQAPSGGSSKKWIIAIVAALVALGAAGGLAFYFLQGKADATEDEGAERPAAKRKAAQPSFVPLDVFIVNLADRDVERFAQIGITMQVEDTSVSDELKVYMPAIRNAVIMILSHKTSDDLLTQEGKELLAREVRREAARAMGYEVQDEQGVEEIEDETDQPRRRKRKRRADVFNPIVRVNYSSFIIQ